MMKKWLWILEIILLGVIPGLLIGFDYFEDSSPYNSLFNFEPIEKSIAYRFLSLDQPYGSDNQPDVRRILNKQLEPNDFYHVWSLIKRHTSVSLPNKEPQLISALAIQNAPYVTLPGGQRILIPDSMPIGVGYCYEWQLVNATCKADDIVIVGTVGDFKN